jgi:hypothetical protein
MTFKPAVRKDETGGHPAASYRAGEIQKDDNPVHSHATCPGP